MSDIAKNLFEKDPKRWFDGYNSLEELNDNMFCFEGTLHAYILILNPDAGDEFDNRLNKLEMDYQMCSASIEFLNESIGFNSNGESVRTALFSSDYHAPDGEIDADKIREILGEVLYDIYKFQ